MTNNVPWFMIIDNYIDNVMIIDNDIVYPKRQYSL